MSNFWGRWKKPWSKEQCKRRYVQGPTITLRQLAVDSGRNKRTLERWSVEGSWDRECRQHVGKLSVATEQKFVEKVSESLSNDLAQIAIYHFHSHRIFHEIAIAIGQDWLDKIRANPATINSVKPSEINFVSLVLDRAIAGERVAAALHYEDLNKAMQALQRHGYLVIDPTQTTANPQE